MTSRADLSAMTQDERLRALERDLIRSGRSLYEWASAIVDERKPVARFMVQRNGSLVSELTPIEGCRFQFFNVGERDVAIEVWIKPLGPPPPAVVSLTPFMRAERMGLSNQHQRGVCRDCPREVGVTARGNASRHVGLTPGSNGLNGLCTGSTQPVRGVFCFQHGVWPCSNCDPRSGRLRECFEECRRGVHESCRGEFGNRSDREFCECECHARGPCPDGCRGDPRNSDCRHEAEDDDA